MLKLHVGLHLWRTIILGLLGAWFCLTKAAARMVTLFLDAVYKTKFYYLAYLQYQIN